MRVTVQTSLGVTVLAALLTGQVPDDQALVSAAGQKHVGAIPRYRIVSFSLNPFPIRS